MRVWFLFKSRADDRHYQSLSLPQQLLYSDPYGGCGKTGSRWLDGVGGRGLLSRN